MLEYLFLLVSLLQSAIRRHSDLAAENLVLRQQLAILTRSTRKRPRLRPRDRLFWVLVRRTWRDWQRHLVLVRPETVISWHRQAWRLFWRWRSRTTLGRPRLSQEVRELIARMAHDNPLWGSERLRGELLKLGIIVSKRSIQRHRLVRRQPLRGIHGEAVPGVHLVAAYARPSNGRGARSNRGSLKVSFPRLSGSGTH